MNEEVLELGGMNINDLAIIFKDLSARELIQEIINAITLNNSAIGSRINDLHNRLSDVELNYVSKSVIGNIPNKIEAQSAIYYTQEEATAYNTEHELESGDDGYVTTETIKTPAVEAVPYTILEIIEENEEVIADTLNDLNEQISNISLTPGPQGAQGVQGEQGPQGEIGPQGIQGPQGTTGSGEGGSIDPSILDDYVTNEELSNIIGNLGNKVDAKSAIYYTQDEADAYNTEHNLEPGDEGYATTETIMVPAVTAVPYSSVSEAINDHFEILSTAIIDRNNDSSSSIDPSLLSNYVTKTELANVIGNLGNKVEAAEATYYTAEDDEVIAGTKQVGDIKTAAIPAVPYTNVAEVIEDDEEIWSAAMADLNSKYESLNS